MIYTTCASVCVEVLIDCHKVVDFKFVSIEEVFIDFLCAFAIEWLGKKNRLKESSSSENIVNFFFGASCTFTWKECRKDGVLETLFQHAQSTRDR